MAFHTNHYMRINQRRQEHLATLGLDMFGASVLELGAGIGDLTTFFLDRDCPVVSLEARTANLERMKETIADYYAFYESTKPQRHACIKFDLEKDDWSDLGTFDLIFAYGILYHVKATERVIALMGDVCKRLCLLETCVSIGNGPELNPTDEDRLNPTQSFHGSGCRPTRAWVFNELKKVFPFVYVTSTQPNHEEFPVDWTKPQPEGVLTRAVFVASVTQLENRSLCDYIPDRQLRSP